MLCQVVIPLLTSGISMANIFIITNQLYNVQVSVTDRFLMIDSNCLLSDNMNNILICQYGYALGSVTLFTWLITSVIAACSRNNKYVSTRVVRNYSVFMVLFWSLGTTIIAIYTDRANKAGIPREPYRMAFTALCASQVGLFLISSYAGSQALKALVISPPNNLQSVYVSNTVPPTQATQYPFQQPQPYTNPYEFNVRQPLPQNTPPLGYPVVMRT